MVEQQQRGARWIGAFDFDVNGEGKRMYGSSMIDDGGGGVMINQRLSSSDNKQARCGGVRSEYLMIDSREKVITSSAEHKREISCR